MRKINKNYSESNNEARNIDLKNLMFNDKKSNNKASFILTSCHVKNINIVIFIFYIYLHIIYTRFHFVYFVYI